VAAIGGTSETCDSCGGPPDGLETVRRVYVTIGPDGTVTRSETTDQAENWCLSCRSMYPHVSDEPDPAAP
jgi:hypothetical protein